MSTEPADAAPPPLRVEVIFCPGPGAADATALALAPGSTLADALRASGIVQRHGLVVDATLRVGIWGQSQPPETPLRDRDRVEVYRPLQVDPKEARRLRYGRHREAADARRRDKPPAGPA